MTWQETVDEHRVGRPTDWANAELVIFRCRYLAAPAACCRVVIRADASKRLIQRHELLVAVHAIDSDTNRGLRVGQPPRRSQSGSSAAASTPKWSAIR